MNGRHLVAAPAAAARGTGSGQRLPARLWLLARQAIECAGAHSAWLVLAVTLAALTLRLVRIGSRSLWLDEAYTAHLAGQPVPIVVSADPYNPPLYPLFLKAWGHLGRWAVSDTGLRLPSALASGLGVGLGVWLVQRLGLPGAALIAGLGTLSSTSVWYGQEARSPALAGLCLLGAAAVLALEAAASPMGSRPVAPLRPARQVFHWTCYVVSMSLALYLNYVAVAVWALLNAIFLGWARPWARPARRTLAAWLAGNLGVAALYRPQVPVLVRAIKAINGHPYAARAAPFVLVGGVLLLAGTAGCWFVWRRQPSLGRTLAAGAACTGVLALDAISLIPLGTSGKRHVAVVLPIALVVFGIIIAWARIPRRWQALLVAAGLPSLFLTLFVFPKEDWRGTATLLERAGRAGDVVVVYRGYAEVPLRRYYAAPYPIIPIKPPGDLSSVGGVDGASRVWLVESQTETAAPKTLAPYLGAQRPLGCERTLYRVSIRRFDAPGASGSTYGATAPACAAGA